MRALYNCILCNCLFKTYYMKKLLYFVLVLNHSVIVYTFLSAARLLTVGVSCYKYCISAH